MPACAYIQWLCDGCSTQLMLRQDTGFPLGWVHVDISATGGRQAKLMLCEMCVAPTVGERVVGAAIAELLAPQPPAEAV